MQRIELNFAARRPAAGLVRWLWLVPGLVSLAGAATWERWYWQPLQAGREMELRAAQGAAGTADTAAKIDVTQLAAEWRQAAAVAEQLNRPWERLFASLEAEAGRPVAILLLEPDAGKGQLVLTAEARDFEAMLAYYRRLQQQEALSAVVLQTHQVNRQAAEKPVRFRITAQWVLQP